MRRRRAKKESSTGYIEKELVDKVSLWILRIIFELDAARKFLDADNRFYSDSLTCFLNLDEYVNLGRDDFSKSDIFAILKKDYKRLQKRKRFSSNKILTKNLLQISELMHLNSVEVQIIEFCILINQYYILEKATDMLGNDINSSQAKKMLGKILDIPLEDINTAFRSNGKLVKSGIVTLNKHGSYDFNNKIEIITDSFADDMCNLDEDISVMIKDAVRPCEEASLSLDDYEHIVKDIDIILPYLQHSIANKETGVNILFYGRPGTGKTELAKTLTEILEAQLFEVSYADEDDEAIDGYRRLKAFKVAQALLANRKIVLMYDEAEDIFDSSDSFFSPKRQDNKAWLNRMLETNTIPTIWITNNIDSIDNAMIRRFDFTLEVPIPNKKQRKKIIKNYSNNLLDKNSIELLAENENLAPALITRATRVVSSLETEDKAQVFTQVLNSTLKAQGFDEITDKMKSNLPNVYDPGFINTTADLNMLTEGIQHHQNARLCLYGPAGTGKSAFGKYVAQMLEKPVILKKVSDLQSMWVGQCEKNIAAAFKEAKEEKAVLIFDEVDSFLQDRANARASWEVSQVNEMLVQMENFEGIFIATTNLMDNLDKASLRRFDLKLEFDFLSAEQSWNMFVAYCKELQLPKPNVSFQKMVESLRYLTPGDFAAVTRQNRFRPIKNLKDFLQRLEDEIAVKNVSSGNIVGFLA
jgi:SpoVK/Ycf46/Vps4 family AAA+-type ATPase